MQVAGLTDDHTVAYFRHQEVSQLAPAESTYHWKGKGHKAKPRLQ